MTDIIVSKDYWNKFVVNASLQNGFPLSKITTFIHDTYDIEYWEKINLDQYRIRFRNEQKMILWLLRWS